jgi:hypothetical protein
MLTIICSTMLNSVEKTIPQYSEAPNCCLCTSKNWLVAAQSESIQIHSSADTRLKHVSVQTNVAREFSSLYLCCMTCMYGKWAEKFWPEHAILVTTVSIKSRMVVLTSLFHFSVFYIFSFRSVSACYYDLKSPIFTINLSLNKSTLHYMSVSPKHSHFVTNRVLQFLSLFFLLIVFFHSVFT